VLSAKKFAARSNQSFTLPHIGIKIRRMLDNDLVGAKEIGAAVATDPALTSKLLKLANSALFRFESQIDSIDKAVKIIGGEALYNVIMAETALSAFGHFSTDVIDLKRFWLQSIYASLVAKNLAKLAQIRGSGRFFLIGLLHNLGELLVAVQAPNLATRCNAYTTKTPPWIMQTQVLGFTYTDCSAELMRQWQLPSNLYQPLLFAHNEEKALTTRENGLTYIALRAAMSMVENEKYQINQLINPNALHTAGLEEIDVEDAIRFAYMEASNLLDIFQPKR
jgi:HD-like signal output (HDOD) protein